MSLLEKILLLGRDGLLILFSIGFVKLSITQSSRIAWIILAVLWGITFIVDAISIFSES